jgi:acetyltransferase-like isoleucine patch superfamily enzyme
MTSVRHTPFVSSTRLAKVIANPANALSGLAALVRGRWCVIKYRLLGRRFRVGRNFRVYGRLDIRGPGEVVFGDNVAVMEYARPWTHSREARLTIGNDVLIGATRFGCAREITVGDWCQLAEAYIMDTDFHSTHVDRRGDDAGVRVAPVHIGRNVWIAQYAGVLPGARIGDNSVVSFGTVCVREYPPNVILLGNPAKVAAPVPGAAPAVAAVAPAPDALPSASPAAPVGSAS